MNRHLISRRSVLAGTAAAGLYGLTGPKTYAAEVNWKKYAGTTLEANLVKGPRGELLQKYASEFTDLTGIKVESEIIPEQQQRQKAVIELTSGKPSFDVIHLSYHVQKRQFDKAGWLADLTGFMNDPTMTTPDLTKSDFSAGGLKFAQNDKGEMHSLPWSVDYFILYWNKDIFAKKGVALPKTLDEMVAAAEKLTDPAAGIYGFTGRGLRNANMALWTNFFLNYGGEFLDDKGNILTDGPEAIAATTMYQRLMKSAPPGVAGFNWMESMASLTQGRAAMWIDASGWAPPIEDPNASRVVGKIGYATVPAGPKGAIFVDLWRRHRHRPGQHQEGSGLSLLPMGGVQDHGRAAVAGRRRRAVPQFDPQRRDGAQGRQDPGVAGFGGGLRQDQQARPARDRSGRRIPRHRRRGADRDPVGGRPRHRIEEGQ